MDVALTGSNTEDEWSIDMRAIFAMPFLFACVIATPAQAGDSSDRMLGSEMSRERSESRIERLHDDKELRDKSRAEKLPGRPVKKKKPVKTPIKQP